MSPDHSNSFMEWLSFHDGTSKSFVAEHADASGSPCPSHLLPFPQGIQSMTRSSTSATPVLSAVKHFLRFKCLPSTSDSTIFNPLRAVIQFLVARHGNKVWHYHCSSICLRMGWNRSTSKGIRVVSSPSPLLVPPWILKISHVARSV